VIARSIYESLVDGNVGHDPTAAASATYWGLVSATNRWRAFDYKNSSPAAQANSMSWAIKPGQAVPAFAALVLEGVVSVQIRIVDPVDGQVVNRTYDMSPLPLVAGWWYIAYGEYRYRRQLVVTDLPAYPDATIYIDITGTADLSVGEIVIGQAVQFGKVKFGLRMGINDYSRKEKNDFGATVLVQRDYAKTKVIPLRLKWADVDAAYNYLASVRATPCLYISTGYFEAATVFGTFPSFEVLIPYAVYADCALEIDGLT
jgi:hypothetical protein